MTHAVNRPSLLAMSLAGSGEGSEGMAGTVLMTDWERGRRAVEAEPERVVA